MCSSSLRDYALGATVLFLNALNALPGGVLVGMLVARYWADAFS